jgi:hypothetical protein
MNSRWNVVVVVSGATSTVARKKSTRMIGTTNTIAVEAHGVVHRGKEHEKAYYI